MWRNRKEQKCVEQEIVILELEIHTEGVKIEQKLSKGQDSIDIIAGDR